MVVRNDVTTMGKNSEEKGLYSHITGVILAGGLSRNEKYLSAGHSDHQ
jgi:hypothetical protein